MNAFVIVGERKFDEAALTRVLTGECVAIAEDVIRCIKKLLNHIVAIMNGVLVEARQSVVQIENGSIEACFQCLSMMMDFQYKGMTVCVFVYAHECSYVCLFPNVTKYTAVHTCTHNIPTTLSLVI